MASSPIEPPSNAKFGFFFTAVFTIIAGYSYFKSIPFWAIFFSGGAALFLAVTVLSADTLQPLNRLWLNFGLFLATIMNPVILGLIFFFMFTPLAILMRLSGRDELRLKFEVRDSYWIARDKSIDAESFKHQF